MNKRYGNVWDALLDPDEAEDLKKRSDYLLLIQAKLYGWSGTNSDRAKRLEVSEQTISNLMKGNAGEFSLNQFKAIARKAGITARL
jgi:predicted XRE-type DNA-binding protein